MKMFSYSRLETYSKCGEYYRLFYLDKTVPKPDTSSQATIVGSICHEVLEEYYKQAVNGVPQAQWLTAEQLLYNYWSKRLTDEGLYEIYGYLHQYEQGIYQLYYRASGEYNGADAIRTGAKKVPDKPEKTTQWATAFAAAGLGPLANYVETESKRVAQEKIASAQGTVSFAPTLGGVLAPVGYEASLGGSLNPTAQAPGLILTLPQDAEIQRALIQKQTWLKYKIQDVYADTFRILRGYKDALLGCNIDHIEYAFSEWDDEFKRVREPVQFPGSDVFLKGFVDLIVTDAYGRKYIIDHKSSKEAPTPGKVNYWEQLLLYSWAWRERKGVLPNFIAINSLRAKTFIPSPVDPELVDHAVKRKAQQIRGIEHEVFVQQNPTDFNSNCINKLTREPCVYLPHCHPKYAASMAAEQALKDVTA